MTGNIYPNPLAHTHPAPPWHIRVGSVVARRLPVGRFRFMNWWCQRPLRPFLVRPGGELGGLQFVCDLRDSTAREVCFTGRYEPQETAVVRGILRPGMTFIDIGANWGYFSLLATDQVGPRGRVASFEPDPRLADLLESNIAVNGLTNIIAVRAAAAAAPGELRLTGFDPNGGNWGLSRVDAVASGEHAFTARATTIDAELDVLGVGNVDLLKMDIEGAEDLALAGMTAGLQSGRYTRLLIELHPDLLAKRGSSPEAVTDRLLAAGYKAWMIRRDAAFSRRAAYARKLNPEEVLIPWEPGQALGSWPHLLFSLDRPLPRAE